MFLCVTRRSHAAVYCGLTIARLPEQQAWAASQGARGGCGPPWKPAGMVSWGKAPRWALRPWPMGACCVWGRASEARGSPLSPEEVRWAAICSGVGCLAGGLDPEPVDRSPNMSASALPPLGALGAAGSGGLQLRQLSGWASAWLVPYQGCLGGTTVQSLPVVLSPMRLLLGVFHTRHITHGSSTGPSVMYLAWKDPRKSRCPGEASRQNCCRPSSPASG